LSAQTEKAFPICHDILFNLHPIEHDPELSDIAMNSEILWNVGFGVERNLAHGMLQRQG
jgi:hypothetical protein